jgi:hypothetical protein
MIGTPDDGGLALRSIVRDDGDDDDGNDDDDGDDGREHGGDIASRPSISAIRLPGSTNSSSRRRGSPPPVAPPLAEELRLELRARRLLPSARQI